MKGLPEEEKFELATINPSFVIGPAISGPGFESQKIIADMVTGKLPGLPLLKFHYVDVRDVALAHVRALEEPEAAGKRVILAAEEMWMADFGKILHDEFQPQGYEFKTSVPPYCFMRFASIFSAEIASILPLWGKVRHLNTDISTGLLGIKYRPINGSVIEMVNGMIEKGWIPDKRPKK